MLKAVIIDDESLAREVLEGYWKRLDPAAPVILFSNAADALEYFETHEADVLFLDIEMPEMNGISFLKMLRHPPLTVFTTAYRNYAFEGFELGVIDFLLKPVSYKRFAQAVEKIREFLRLKDQQAGIEEVPPEETPASIFVKSGVQRIRLCFEDVTHVQGLKDYAIIHTASGKIVLKGSIKAMLDIFPEKEFVRVHKSFIVSLSKITRVERNRIVLKDQEVPIGRNFKEEVRRLLFKD